MSSPPAEPAGYDPAGKTVAWFSFYDEARQRFAAAGLSSPDVDARRIVEEASGYEGADFHQGLKELATKRGVARFDAMVERRLAGEPLQYVVGSWGFRTLDLFVDRRVLIPRPETEVVADVALSELARLSDGRRLRAIDLGTGTGAIGLSIVAERADTEVILTDVSAPALQVARANLAGTGRAAARVTVLEGSWFEPLPETLLGEVDVIVSNPPYVSADDDLPAEVKDWEPVEALISPDGGTAAVAHLIAGAGEWLRPGGALVVEMAPHHTAWARELATESGFVEVESVVDMAQRERAIRARWPN